MLKYLLSKKVRAPIYLIFEPTARCNSNCSFCYNKEKLNESEEMKAEEIDLFTRKMDKLLTLALSGGEPFLREDLSEVVEIFSKNVDMEYLIIPTNGLLPDLIKEKTLRIIDKYEKKLIVTLSLDGLHQKHDEIRGVEGNFERLLETYDNLSAIDEDNLEISVNTCLNSSNKEEFVEIREFVRKRMPKTKAHNFSFMRGSFPDSDLKEVDLDFVKKNKEELQKTAIGSREFSFDPYGSFLKAIRAEYYSVYENNQGNERNWDCYAGNLACYIDFKGNLYPCESLPPIGNLEDYDYQFEDLWFSEVASGVRKGIKDGKCNCNHGCFVKLSLMFNLKIYPKLIRHVGK